MLLLGASLVGLGGRAEALPPGVTDPILTLDGEDYNGTDVVQAGQTLAFQAQYSEAAAGQEVTFTFGDTVSIPEFPENEAFAGVQSAGGANGFTVTFKDPWPAGVNQGVINFDVKVNEVEKSSHETITWTINGEETGLDLIVKKPGDEFEDVTEHFAKKASPGNLNRYVSVDADGTVSVSDDILGQAITYTLELDSEQPRANFTVSDQLPEGLEYVGDSFDAEITTWDEEGLNKETNAFGFSPDVDVTESSFTWTGDIPGPSELDVTYQATFTDDARAALETELQGKYNALIDEDKHGSFSANFTNTAAFGETERTAKVSAAGRIPAPPKEPGPEPDSTFAKSGSWGERVLQHGQTNEDGELIEPLDIVYTLKTDLGKLKGESDFQLETNLVVEDTLPEQLTWNTGAEPFIAATGGDLTEADECPSVEEFAADKYVGQFCVDGQRLLINVGKENTGITSIDVAAQVTTIAGMAEGSHPTEDSEAWEFRNTATFHWGDEPNSYGHGSKVVILPESGDDGHYDETRFTKTTNTETVTVKQGETLDVDYDFVVSSGTDYDVTKSYITDHVDWEIFDRDVDPVLSGSYAGTALDQGDFAWEINDDDHLVISLSDDAKAEVGNNVNGKWEVNLTLTTLPFDGKETKEMKNKAVLFGEDEQAKYWSETYSESTSYGNEAEVRKRVYDRADAEWVPTLDAQLDADGELVESTYVYRVEFIPHGTFDNVNIISVVDNLPEEVRFIGFVTEDNAATGEPIEDGPVVDIGGNLEAIYDADDHTVTLQQQEGTRLEAGNPIAAYLAVDLLATDAPVTNAIGSSEATIVPVDGPSIDIEKWSDEGEGSGPSYDEDGALNNDGYDGDYDDDHKDLTTGADQQIEFTISNDGGEALTDVEVSDETAEGTHGDIENLVCAFPDESTGTTWEGPFEPATQFECTGTLPGLDAGQTHSDTATVIGTGIISEDEVTDSDDWNAQVKSYAIGDYVWIDSNRDGLQDSDEEPLPDVNVELLDADGEFVAETSTDLEGRYLFDNLPAGKYRVQFTLTDEQAAKYQFTKVTAGDDVEADSDADTATGLTGEIVLDDSNEFLTSGYDRDVAATQGVDPTWDAGVNLKSVSVGDYVWVDHNRDGIQDDGEPGIRGVTMCLTGPDGEPVTDVFGDPVETVQTDENGQYVFENLPALSGEDTYTVCIDRDASKEALAPYVPTTEEAGGDREVDSSTWTSETVPGDLHNHGDQDMTLDFGFITKSYAIGDYVWIDSNRDGIQGEGEDPLAGVTVELLDESGDVVETTATDDEGRYLFDNLPAGKYRVQFTLTDEQAAKYQFTKVTTGDDVEVDSDADTATGLTGEIVLDDSNEFLTSDYDRDVAATQGIDPTWDAGVIVLEDEPVDPPTPGKDPTTPGDDPATPGPGTDGNLPTAGANVNPALIAAALALLAAGAWLVSRRNSVN